MAQNGKIAITMVITAPSALVAEGDRLFAAHAEWISRSHRRDGNMALLSYNIVKGPELSNALDPSSAPTGNTSYVIAEVFETQDGVADHWRMAVTEWSEFGAFAAWAGKCTVIALHGSPVVQSLW